MNDWLIALAVWAGFLILFLTAWVWVFWTAKRTRAAKLSREMGITFEDALDLNERESLEEQAEWLRNLPSRKPPTTEDTP